jgi:glycosyltransferase involved in cell wall biosynthesis
MEKRVTSRSRISGGGITLSNLLYILRTFPELSETFVLREMQALRAAGVSVSVLAIAPGQHAEMVREAEARGPGLPPVRYLSRAYPPSGRAENGARGRSDHPDSRDAVRHDDSSAPRPDAGTRGSRHRPAGGGSDRTFLGELARDLASLRGHPRRTARALRLAAYARRAVALVPPDTARLHAHFASDAAALARYVGALARIPYRITAHAYDIHQDPFLLSANLAGAEHVYTVAHANLDALRARAADSGWDPARVSVLRCGIDLAGFSYRDPTPMARPARLLAVARLVPKKGLLTLLEAIARLNAEGPGGAEGAGRAVGIGGAAAAEGAGVTSGEGSVHLTIAGDGPLAGEIAARAALPDLAGCVTRLGPVPAERVRELMREADLFVLAARIAEDGDRDGLPVTLIEAMALGLPVLTTAIGGIPELVTEDTGRLVPAAASDDTGALAAAIREAMRESPEKRALRARSARRRIEAEYDLSLQVAALRP